MRNPRQLDRGGSMVEFTLLVPVWLPLLLGTMWLGSAMIRGLGVTQVARDADSMFSRGTDFSVAAGANSNSATANSVLPNLAGSLGTVTTTGTGVIVFSTLTYVGNSVCASLNGTNGTTVYGVAPTAGNAGSHTGNCTNWGKFVFTQQYVVGNSGLRSSNFGAPVAADVDSTNSYQITLLNSVTDSGNASTFNLLPAPAELGADGYQSGQPVYVVEAFFSGRGQAGYTQGGDYAYAVF